MATEKPPELPSKSTTDLSVGSQIAIEFLGLAKDEVLIRIRVRDTLLAAYAAAAFTAMAAIIASPHLGAHYLYGVPYLSLAFCGLVSYHHAGIGALCNHCVTDLFPKLAREGRVLPYEYSNVYHQYHRKNATRRALAHGAILLLPPAIALVVNLSDLRPQNYTTSPEFAALWGLSLLLMLISAAVIIRSNRTHYEGFSHRGSFPQSKIFDDLAGR